MANRLDTNYALGHTSVMSTYSAIPQPNAAQPETAVDLSSQKVAEAIKILLSALSVPEQQRILREITATISPIETPRAGAVLGTIVRLLPRSSEWTVGEIQSGVALEGVEATTKEIYNALGYLTRKGHVRRIGYGRYLIAGAEIVTSDDLGGKPCRYED